MKQQGNTAESLGRKALWLGIGIGLYRCLHEWPIWMASLLGLSPLPNPFLPTDFYFVVDAGKVAGVILYVALSYGPQLRRSSLLPPATPSILLVGGALAPVAALAGLSFPHDLIDACLLLMGAGAGMLFCQWIEACGHVPPLRIIQALALSYIVKLIVFGVVTSLGGFLGSLIFIAASATASLQVCAWNRSFDNPTWKRKLPSAPEFRSFAGLFLWVAVFAFAYGIGTGSTTMAHHPWITGLGTATPMVLILLASLGLGDRFDRRILYAIALPLMTAGLVSLEFMGAAPEAAQFLLSAAFDTFRLLAFWEVCSFAFRTEQSSMFLGACVRVLCLCVNDGAAVLTRVAPDFWDQGVVVLAIVMVAIAVGSMIYLPRLTGADPISNAGLSWASNGLVPTVDLRDQAENVGLSRRETTVFELMVQGKTTAQISEELFISKGAVRAHTSRIYEKFGVHSRTEFDKLFPSSG